MTKATLRYDKLIEDALRGVVSTVLRDVASNGLPGHHHFFVSFRTHHPGVAIGDELRARYPEDMTIVLQHQFWDLDVDENGFAVTLSFNKVPQRLVVPFAAVTAFADPSVKFGLQFQPKDTEGGAKEANVTEILSGDRKATPIVSRKASRTTPALAAATTRERTVETESTRTELPSNDPKVVPLDTFRRK
jgi:uncharacterized protein